MSAPSALTYAGGLLVLLATTVVTLGASRREARDEAGGGGGGGLGFGAADEEDGTELVGLVRRGAAGAGAGLAAPAAAVGGERGVLRFVDSTGALAELDEAFTVEDLDGGQYSEKDRLLGGHTT